MSFTVQANTGGERTGTLTVAGRTFSVTQAQACSYTINPTSRDFTEVGGTGTVAVSTTAACGWTAVSHDAWILITAGASGSGNGTVSYRVLPNLGNRRDGTMTIAGRTFTVNQERELGSPPKGRVMDVTGWLRSLAMVS